jgi:hypothetical protein
MFTFIDFCKLIMKYLLFVHEIDLCFVVYRSIMKFTNLITSLYKIKSEKHLYEVFHNIITNRINIFRQQKLMSYKSVLPYGVILKTNWV